MRNAQIFNLAETVIHNFDSVDFRNNYFFALIEDTHAFEQNVKRVLHRDFGFAQSEKSQEIADFMMDNYEALVRDFAGIHTGDMCVSSVAFGEQHVSFSGLNIPENKWKQATVIFESLGFSVKDGNAFYIVDGGVKIDLDALVLSDFKSFCENSDC